jgi:phosphopantetheinyl transferase (holo-ACP synthase)
VPAAHLEDLVRQIGSLRGVGWGVAVPGEGELCPAEAAAIARACPERRAEFAAGHLAARLFFAKEAASKAHYPLARQVFGFHWLRVDLAQVCARFTDHPEVASILPESRWELPLLQVVGNGLILSLSAVPAGIS